jgi:multiple sugar transport system substrate-binding protein
MHNHPTRRDFLRLTGASLVGATLYGKFGARQAWAETMGDDKLWKQCAGVTLNFISENTPPSSAIAANLKPFQDLTGIKLNLTQLQLGDVVQKVALDLGSRQGFWQVIYADPYQILAPYYQGFMDLNQFINDNTLPQVPKGIEDFIPTQLAADGRFVDKKGAIHLAVRLPDDDLDVPQGPVRETSFQDAAGPGFRPNAVRASYLGAILPDRRLV